MVATVSFPSFVTAWSPPPAKMILSSRRAWCGTLVASNVLSVGISARASPSSTTTTSAATTELPLALRDYTKLAPLGPAQPSFVADKTTGLSLEKLAERLTKDLTMGSTGRGGYIISGDLSADLFRDDCVFLDPTNRVSSLSQYQRALQILFDTDRSSIELIGPLIVDPERREISGRFRSQGMLKLPWKPYVTEYQSDIVYAIDQDGLVREQRQTWSKSAFAALRESFTPTLFTPASPY